MAEKDKLIVGRADGTVINRLSSAPENEVTEEFIIGAPSFSPGLYPHWGILRVLHTQEAFLLTDRSFTGKPFANGGINRFFADMPGQAIRARAGVADIADVGGGRKSASARELAEIYPKSQVTNIDLVIEEAKKTKNLVEKPGSALEIPSEDASFDILYTHQVLPFLTSDRARKALGEIARVLRPGGVGFVDDGHFSSTVDQMKKVSDEMGLKVDSANKSYGGRFLIIYR